MATPTSGQASDGNSGNQAIGRCPPRYDVSGRGRNAGKCAGPMIGPSATTAAVASSVASDRRPPAPGRGDERPHDHRGADAVQDVDAVEVVPVPAAAQDVLLQPEQIAEHQHLEPAPDRRADHRRAVDLGGDLALEADRHRDADQQQEEARRDPADEAGPAVGHRRLRRLVAPGVVEVGLDHQDDGQAPQPVDRLDAPPCLGPGRRRGAGAGSTWAGVGGVSLDAKFNVSKTGSMTASIPAGGGTVVNAFWWLSQRALTLCGGGTINRRSPCLSKWAFWAAKSE